eukprot:1161139-Pelagomonas_calceolata.AAC.8
MSGRGKFVCILHRVGKELSCKFGIPVRANPQMFQLIQGMGSLDSPTHIQEDGVESGLGTLKLFAQSTVTVNTTRCVAVRLLAGHLASCLAGVVLLLASLLPLILRNTPCEGSTWSSRDHEAMAQTEFPRQPSRPSLDLLFGCILGSAKEGFLCLAHTASLGRA